jgi:hypothetical protein
MPNKALIRVNLEVVEVEILRKDDRLLGFWWVCPTDKLNEKWCIHEHSILSTETKSPRTEDSEKHDA